MSRRKYIAVNSPMVGILDRLSSKETPFAKHPMIRQSWGITDSFRGAQGYYITLDAAAPIAPDGPSPGVEFVNFSEGTQHLLGSYENPTSNWWSWVLSDPGKNRGRPFKIKSSQLGDFGPDSGLWTGQQEKGNFCLLYDSTTWNVVGLGGTYFPDPSSRPPMFDLLDQEILEGLDGTPYSQGYPYAYRYLVGGFEGTDPRVEASVSGLFSDMETSFVDYTMEWRGDSPWGTPSTEATTPYRVNVRPVYNFYLATSPAYENVTFDIEEPLLPNYYILERIRHLPAGFGFSFNRKYNRQVLVASTQEEYLDSDRPLNADLIENGFALLEGVKRADDPNTPQIDESNMRGVSYFQAYCSQLKALKEGGAGSLEGVTTSFAASQKNIAVVSQDIPLLGRPIVRDTRGTAFDTSDDLLAIDTYPFYNLITLPYDSHDVRGIGGEAIALGGLGNMQLLPGAPTSVFQEMYNRDGANRRALNMLQMYIAYTLSNSDTSQTTQPFHIYTEGSGGNKRVVEVNMDFVLDMMSLDSHHAADFDFMDDALAAYNTPGLISTDEGSNLIFLRDMGHLNYSLLSQNFSHIFSYGPVRSPLINHLHDVGRKMYDILANKSCFNETLMYVIEKRVVNDDGSVSEEPAQTFYISKDFINNADINYIDTQIRYGVVYNYEVKQVRLVASSRYKYNDVTIWHTPDDGQRNYGKALGNAIGAYADPAIQGPFSEYYEADDIYLKWDEDTEKIGYFKGTYIYQPSNRASLYPPALYMDTRNATATDYTDESLSSTLVDQALPRLKDAIHLKFISGDGSEGNATGGMLSAEMTGYDTPPPSTPVDPLNPAGQTNSTITTPTQRTYAEYFIDRIYRSAANNPNWAVQLTPSLQYDWQTYGTPNFFQVKSDQGFQQLLAEGKIFGPPGWLSPSPDDGSAGGMLEMFRVNAGNQTPDGAADFIPDEAALLVLFTHEAKEEVSKGFTPSFPGEKAPSEERE